MVLDARDRRTAALAALTLRRLTLGAGSLYDRSAIRCPAGAAGGVKREASETYEGRVWHCPRNGKRVKLDQVPLRLKRGKAIRPEQSTRESVDRPDPRALICGGRILAGFAHARALPLPESSSAADQHDVDIVGRNNPMSTESLSRPRVDTLAGQRAAVGLSSLVLGLVFVYFVGFAPISAVHNAAHDTRHTAAFPCH